MRVILGGTPRRLLTPLAGLVVLANLLVASPARATPPDPSLIGWSFEIVTTYTQTGPDGYSWRDEATYNSEAGSFALSWTGTVSRSIPSECPGGSTIIGQTSSANGSGVGTMEGSTGGSPADYGLPTDIDYVSVIPAAPNELEVTNVVSTCPGETFVTKVLEHPYTSEVFIPGTTESLAALSVGTVLTDEYERSVTEDGYVTTHAVSYVATKGPTPKVACDDGLDNDGDGFADAGTDPGCVSASDPSEFGQAQCDNGKDDDGNGKYDWRAGAGDPGCDSLLDELEYTDPCADATAEERHRTTLEAPARLDVALAPDPHLATINLGLTWCETPAGPRIMQHPEAASPSGWWTSTQNWLLLGALESFGGLTIEPTGEPSVLYGSALASVTDSLEANLDGTDAALNAVPLGKLFKPLKKALAKYADKLDPLAKRLKKYDGLVWKQSNAVDKAHDAVRTARKTTSEFAERVDDLQRQLKDASGAEKRALEKDLAEAKDRYNSAKRTEGILSSEYQEALRELRRIKAEEEKLARQVDEVLDDVRRALRKANDLKDELFDALDEIVDGVRPDWAREVVEALVKQLRGQLDKVLDRLENAIKDLAADKIVELMKSGDATDAILKYLKSVYKSGANAISTIGVPIWDASFTVNLGGSSPSLADNSKSRFIFTIKTEPKLTTS